MFGKNRTRGKSDFATLEPSPFSPAGETPAPDRWWTTFGDPNLDASIERALGQNFQLAAALQRLVAARAVVRREASDLFPDIDGVADIGSTFGPGNDPTNYTLGFNASYQVDLWGQIQSRVDAEAFRAHATAADYQVVALTLASEIARTWFSLIEAHAQMKLLEEQIKTNRTGLELQESRFGLGLIRSPDVLRQRQLVESTREQAVVVRSSIEVLEHRLALLLGTIPQDATFEPGDVLPELPPMPATGLPSELLKRRPDVRRDYLSFQAADRDLASAITAQYPRLNLTGSLVNSADAPENLFRDWFLGIGAQLIAPLIDGGQRRAEVDRTSAVLRERFNEYGQTMLIAFAEVEDALALERYQLERIERLEVQSELAVQAFEQLRGQYLIGDADYLDLLSAITAQQRLQRDTLTARLDLLLIRVTLYSALAGGFESNGLMLQSDPIMLEDVPDPMTDDSTLEMDEPGNQTERLKVEEVSSGQTSGAERETLDSLRLDRDSLRLDGEQELDRFLNQPENAQDGDN
ncbi:MAG: efflux transporter outer membrane subunit [Planctomycetota bacterium]